MAMTDRTWMTTDDVMRELKFSTPDATRKWLRRLRVVGISRYPCGRTKIFARADVEKALTDARRRTLTSSGDAVMVGTGFKGRSGKLDAAAEKGVLPATSNPIASPDA